MNTIAMQQPVIEHGIITVANIYPAKSAGQSAWIKDTAGVMFGYRPEKHHGINVGESYEIEFTAKVKNGTTYRDIQNARMATKPGPAPDAFTGSREQAPPARAASPNGQGAGQYYRPTAPKDARRMFLCSTLNAFIQTGRIDAHRDHMTAIIKEILAAYDATVALED